MSSRAITAAPRVSTSARMTWMDLLRGLAIVLVILWHAPSILLLYDLPVPEVLLGANIFLAPFRMPTLMFLSGLLLPASLRKSAGVYYSGKLRRIAWPFALWTVVHFLLYRPDTTLGDFHFWTTSYLWFLAYILIYYLVAPLVTWMPTWIAILAPLLVTPLVDEDSRRRFFFLAAFFFVGKLAAEHRDVLERMLRSPWTWLTLPVAAAYSVFYATSEPLRYQALHAPFSLAGVIALVLLARTVASAPWTRPLQFIGRNSLIFYVTHFPVIILVMTAGLALGVPIPVIVLVGAVAAFLVGAACVWLAERTPVRWLFVFPGRSDLPRTPRRRAGRPTERIVT